jgi:hypothetical protein
MRATVMESWGSRWWLVWVVSGVVGLAAIVPPAAAGGARWTIEPAPDPSASGNALGSVSCTGSFFCVTVGNSGVGGPFLEDRVNGTWSLQPITTPAGSPRPDGAEGSLSCRARDDCTVVGSTTSAPPIEHSQGTSTPYALRWDGQAWRSESVPHATKDNELVAIDCRASLPCVAVGAAYSRSRNRQQPLVERRTGGVWHQVLVPAVPGFRSLSAVSCAGPNLCLAIGSVTEVWNGHDWRRGHDPPLPGVPGLAQLSALSCASHQTCLVVGSWTPIGSMHTLPLVERWRRGRWDIEATPRVPHATGSKLSGISCRPDDRCVAVGSGWPPGAAMTAFPVIELRRHGRWTLQHPQLPPHSSFSGLGDVSCAASTCTAVGMYFPASGNGVPLIERYG